MQLQLRGDGFFEGSFTTTFPGLYQCHFLAVGYTRRGTTFQREETRTISVFKDRIPEGRGHDEDDKGGRGQPSPRVRAT